MFGKKKKWKRHLNSIIQMFQTTPTKTSEGLHQKHNSVIYNE